MGFLENSWFQAPWFIQKNTYKSTTFHGKVCSSINFDVSGRLQNCSPPDGSGNYQIQTDRSDKQLCLFRNSPFPRETNHTKNLKKKLSQMLGFLNPPIIKKTLPTLLMVNFTTETAVFQRWFSKKHGGTSRSLEDQQSSSPSWTVSWAEGCFERSDQHK